jgi:ABC-type branched-subunit amino acid transport system substrate-binding protein
VSASFGEFSELSLEIEGDPLPVRDPSGVQRPESKRVRVVSWPGLLQFGFAVLWGLGSGSYSQAAEIKIGLLVPPEEAQGASIREGALLAASEKREGTNHISLIVRGRAGQWGADGVEVARMVTDDGVQGLIAPPDGAASHLTLQVSGRTAVPVVALCADSSVGKTGVPWLLRVVPQTTDEAKALFDGLASGQGTSPSRWVAIVPKARAGTQISNDLTRMARTCGVRLETMLPLDEASAKSNALKTAVLKARPTGILLWLAPGPAGTIARRLRNAGFSGTLAGPGWLRSSEFVSTAGKALEGFLIPAIVQDHASAARWNFFRNSFKNQWHHEPDVMAEMSYDAVGILTDLLDKSGFGGPSHRITHGLAWTGVTGNLTFDRQGNRIVKLELLTGKEGGFVQKN